MIPLWHKNTEYINTLQYHHHAHGKYNTNIMASEHEWCRINKLPTVANYKWLNVISLTTLSTDEIKQYTTTCGWDHTNVPSTGKALDNDDDNNPIYTAPFAELGRVRRNKKVIKKKHTSLLTSFEAGIAVTGQKFGDVQHGIISMVCPTMATTI